jgi:predicted DNA-binding transcriptional regulator AlpA
MKETIELQGVIYDTSQLIIKRYGISTMTLRRWTQCGRLPQPIRLGRTKYFARDEVEARLSCGEYEN